MSGKFPVVTCEIFFQFEGRSELPDYLFRNKLWSCSVYIRIFTLYLLQLCQDYDPTFDEELKNTENVSNFYSMKIKILWKNQYGNNRNGKLVLYFKEKIEFYSWHFYYDSIDKRSDFRYHNCLIRLLLKVYLKFPRPRYLLRPRDTSWSFFSQHSLLLRAQATILHQHHDVLDVVHDQDGLQKEIPR